MATESALEESWEPYFIQEVLSPIYAQYVISYIPPYLNVEYLVVSSNWPGLGPVDKNVA